MIERVGASIFELTSPHRVEKSTIHRVSHQAAPYTSRQ